MTTKRENHIILMVAAASLLAGVFSYLSQQESNREGVEVRVGWQTAWATQGQVVEALKHTDILRRNGVQASFTGFPAGPPMVEAALAESLDIVAGGSQPILQLLDRSKDWVIVARHAYVHLGILVPPESTIINVRDLKGRKVGVPLGSTSERFVLLQAEAAGLSDKDLELVNLGIEEQGEVVRVGSRQSWGEIAAVSGWEPTVTLLVRSGNARLIAEENEITVVAMRRDFVREHRDVAIGYLHSLLYAWHYYATNRTTMNQLFLQETSLPIDQTILETVAENEPNMKAATVNDINIEITPALLERLRATIKFLSERGKLGRSIKIEDEVDLQLLQEALRGLKVPAARVIPSPSAISVP